MFYPIRRKHQNRQNNQQSHSKHDALIILQFNCNGISNQFDEITTSPTIRLAQAFKSIGTRLEFVRVTPKLL